MNKSNLKNPKKNPFLTQARFEELKKLFCDGVTVSEDDCFGRMWDAIDPVCVACADFTVCGAVAAFKLSLAKEVVSEKCEVNTSNISSEKKTSPKTVQSEQESNRSVSDISETGSKPVFNECISEGLWKKIESRIAAREAENNPLPVADFVAFIKERNPNMSDDEVVAYIKDRHSRFGGFRIKSGFVYSKPRIA